MRCRVLFRHMWEVETRTNRQELIDIERLVRQMIKADIMEKLKQYHQEHLIQFYDELSDSEKRNLERQLEELDFSYIDIFEKKENSETEKAAIYEPLEAMRLEDIQKEKEQFERAGISALKECKVGAVLLAGGQGTRLGFDKPKGMFNIGVNKELYIFERIISNLLDTVNQTGCYIPLFVMTSEKNDAETRAFFKEKNYFGYDKKFIYFFVQSMAPSMDFNGKFYMEEKDRISLSPNGNGGWFSSMIKSGLLKNINMMGIEWLNVFSVDNVLQRIADPTFVGATVLSGCPSSAKVVRKAAPDERVGVMCKKNGKPSIVEYYELTEDMMHAKDSHGEPAYNYGVILNYMFRVKELVEINNNTLVNHMVEKKIPYINDSGEHIVPDKPNGYKFETLILDMINMLDDCLVYEVERKKEFAPVKNKEGVDSIDTARELLQYNGIEI